MPKDSEFSIICLKVCKQSGNEGIGFELGDRVYSFNSSLFHRTNPIDGYIDVGDGCWRRNVLATTLRCW